MKLIIDNKNIIQNIITIKLTIDITFNFITQSKYYLIIATKNYNLKQNVSSTTIFVQNKFIVTKCLQLLK